MSDRLSNKWDAQIESLEATLPHVEDSAQYVMQMTTYRIMRAAEAFSQLPLAAREELLCITPPIIEAPADVDRLRGVN